MHNLIKNTKSVEDAYNASKSNLSRKINLKKKRKKARGIFADENEDLLKKLHVEYNNKADVGKLCELKPVWTHSEDPDSEYQLALGMYGPERPVIAKHREWLTENNSLKKEELICPICSIHTVEEMDHFAPKSIFPEYSTHLNNLIPLCHRCNKKKDDDWVEKSGRQTYFNAFYDAIDGRNLLRINISFRRGLLYNLSVDLNGNDVLGLDENIFDRVKRTFAKQNLKKRYEEEIRSLLDREIRYLTADYTVHKTFYKDIRMFQKHQQETWRQLIDTDSFDIVTDYLLYKYLQSNPEIVTEMFDRISDEVAKKDTKV